MSDIDNNREDNNGRLREAWSTWLETMRWDYAVDVTFASPVTVEQLRRLVRRWLRALRMRNAYAALIPAVGKGGRLHGHLLLGGVSRNPFVATRLKETWERGRAAVTPFSPKVGPRGGLVRYRVSDQDHDPAEITMIGTPKEYKPRRRKRR